MAVIFDKSVPGRRGVTLPKQDVPCDASIPAEYRRSTPLKLAELSESTPASIRWGPAP